LNPSKSNFQGPVFTISISSDGEYRFDGGTLNFSFRCDGKDIPTAKNRTRVCVKSSAAVLDLTQKEDGAATSMVHWEILDKSKIFVSTATAFSPSGPVITGQIVAMRMSGSDGFAGQWRDTTYLRQHADLTLSLDNQALHIDYPNAGQRVDAPLNGADTMMQGPHAPAGVTYSARLAGAREISVLTKHNGKALTQEPLTLSSDGRVLTESWWNPDRPNDKSRLVYEKR
jgi:hypothetical protein